MFMLLELLIVSALGAVAFLFPELGSKWFRSIERAFAPLARRRGVAVFVVGLVPVALRLILLPILPIPEPGVHDEFSYLLAADTFAHGRVTNPPHPLWIHFESIHVLQQPTYASMYFPAQGLILAAGQVMGGDPWLGVLVSVGAMCGAICWMLQGWLPAQWALLGGLLAGMRFGIFSYWMNSYWGGAAAGLGGALVLGALPRIVRHRRVRDALLTGFGLAVLANSRPYEGLVFSLPVGAALFAWMLGKNRPPVWESVRRIVLPLVLVLTLAGGAMGYYFWRVTGNPFRTPEQVNLDTYHMAPPFLWQSPKPHPEYHHTLLRNYYLFWLREYAKARSLVGLVGSIVVKSVLMWSFYLEPALTLPLLAAMGLVPYGYPWSRINPRLRFLLIAGGVMSAGLALEVYFWPHYAAPMTGLILALVVQAMRYLRLWRWRGRPTGLFLVRAVPLTCVLVFLMRAGAQPLRIPLTPFYPQTWCCAQPGIQDRAIIQGQLMRTEGRHLAIVRYTPDHNIHREWVYNGADIDGGKVVWAREMEPAWNEELIRYFKDRHVWLVEPDGPPPMLSPYPLASKR